MDVATNLEQIQQKIRQACLNTSRNPEDITIIGVTKYVTIERTREAIEAGVTNLGENRLEGFQQKYDSFQDKAIWHFIGTLQSRKVKDVIQQIDVLHSLDRISLAKEINKRAERKIDCFVQVNVSGESSKHGLAPDEVANFIKEIEKYPHVRVIGLMTMAPHIKDEDRLRSIFKQLKKLQLHIQDKQHAHAPCMYLSMGMSNDYQLAIEEGATHVRIGTNLVG
ncbi:MULTISPECIES: YggS family pyridoxal phosphate-dependent enzyme [Virgibacillus]|uniref:Pyridoxal phosphate homeostasis protein n=2 Tax=Virgibacillus TaxID=84406 RepID=A0A024QD63_9BACI|nr:MULTISPECIES: YggS family pyridoxal phosphate-dependent enzyme [Virgibacillus]EQB36499.1 hypothetical protein M948_15825 [Virgibacillus sp. CM-4]MYL42333.1 YggS family pyridoxal phosphate-dependent enzyme [Virgibacillus massiliensis]GGJ43429.1 YggS family pyridoxal phosphate enzyme [Virgibacillus kapii]CDQ40197.1 pyridoxal phosphate enzyme, YggS family [Virgibacillus massiliensis]